MPITSLQFAAFFVFVLGVYYFLPRRMQNYWLLGASYFFYASWDWQFALTLIVVTLVNFAVGQNLAPDRHPRPALLWMGIAFNALTLVFFKSANFFVPEFLALLNQAGINIQPGSLAFLLPLGLSFRVLENISYLVDVYRGQTPASKDLAAFALYLVYFPKMVAGPIERARTFLPKLAEERVVDNDTLRRSAVLIIVGLVRKLVIADSLSAAITSTVFITPAEFPAPELLAWLFVYAFSLYNDFAGYTSLMRGVSGLFGIALSPNFNLPYFSRSFNEFWSRWHITLSYWLRDYIFFPLRRALIGKARGRMGWINLIVPPMITMLASGFWHGTGWNMLLWGGLHGVYLIFEQLFRLWRPAPPAELPLWRHAAAMGGIFLLVSLAWIPFRLDAATAGEYLRGLLAFSTYEEIIIRPRLFLRLFFIMVFMLPVIGLDWLQHHYDDEVFFFRWPRPAQSLLLAVALFLIFIAYQSGSGPQFVYQGF